MDQPTKIVFAFDPATHLYLGPVTLDASDLSPQDEGVFLIPGNCLDIEPPTPGDGMRVMEQEGVWVVEHVPVDPVDPPPPAPTLEQRAAVLLAGVDAHLNAAARAKRYDDIRAAALRAGYPGPFHDEGMAFATWMDSVYAKCYEVLAEVQAGDIEEPTLEQLIGMLPVLQLPE